MSSPPLDDDSRQVLACPVFTRPRFCRAELETHLSTHPSQLIQPLRVGGKLL